MLLKQILLSLSLVIIFIGCAPSKLAIDEFEIIGQVLDDESEEPIENVVVYVKSIGWDCDPATDEDGEYLVDSEECIRFKNHLESLDPKSDNILEFSIDYDHDDYEPYDESYSWNLKNTTFRPTEILLVPLDIGELCPFGREPCSNDPAGTGCCKVCPPGTYWAVENNAEVCKSTGRVLELEDASGEEYLFIKIKASQVSDFSFGLDGFSVDEAEEMEIIDWDDDTRELGILITDDNRRLEINCTISDSEYTQTIEWNPDVTKLNADNLVIKWDEGKNIFKANWETK